MGRSSSGVLVGWLTMLERLDGEWLADSLVLKTGVVPTEDVPLVTFPAPEAAWVLLVRRDEALGGESAKDVVEERVAVTVVVVEAAYWAGADFPSAGPQTTVPCETPAATRMAEANRIPASSPMAKFGLMVRCSPSRGS